MQIYGEADVQLSKKWGSVLSSDDKGTMAPIKLGTDTAFGVARMLENTGKWLKQMKAMRSFSEAAPVTVAGDIAGYDKVILGLVRRIGFNILGNNLVGIQPMEGPTGLCFAIRPRYNDGDGREIYLGAPNTTFTGRGSAGAQGADPVVTSTDASTNPFTMTVGAWHSTAQGEGDIVSTLSTTVDSVPVAAKTRTLKANFSMEMAQDLANQHQVDANSMMGALMANQISGEINYESLRLLYVSAVLGASDTATPGTYNLDTDTDGSWIGEKGRALMMRIQLECSIIMQQTRLGHGNFVVCDPKTYALLANAGYISDFGPSNDMFSGSDAVMRDATIAVGKLPGGITVYRDDYAVIGGNGGFCLVGWRGAGIAEAGMFYNPYVPLWGVDTVDPQSGQPIKMMKTRAGRVANPLCNTNGAIEPRSNPCYRLFAVSGLLF